MVILGVLYAFMGMICMKHVKEASMIMQAHRSRKKSAASESSSRISGLGFG